MATTTRKGKTMKNQTRLVLSDLHMPFQSDELLTVWLHHLGILKPDGIDIIGDMLDCYTLSRFNKNPARKGDIQQEVDLARSFLEEMVRVAPSKCDIRYSEGNHENRLKQMLWGKVKELAPLRNLDIPQLLDLKSLGIRYYRPESPYRIRDLWYLHGDLARKSNWSMTAGGMGAKAVCARIRGNAIIGHTHQMGHVSFRGWDGLTEGYEVGCMCRFDLEYIVGMPQWQQGWAVVHFPKAGGHQVELIRVLDKGRKRIVVAGGDVLATIGPAKKHFG
jgi:hypothetical protein